jgi:hypothetical protein
MLDERCRGTRSRRYWGRLYHDKKSAPIQSMDAQEAWIGRCRYLRLLCIHVLNSSDGNLPGMAGFRRLKFLRWVWSLARL